jgi:hypothetical protein
LRAAWRVGFALAQKNDLTPERVPRAFQIQEPQPKPAPAKLSEIEIKFD